LLLNGNTSLLVEDSDKQTEKKKKEPEEIPPLSFPNGKDSMVFEEFIDLI
jgi:hypothetical protein